MTGAVVAAWQMWIEAVRARLLLVVPLYGLLGILLLPTAADLSLGESTRGVSDLGLFLLWLLACGTAVLIGVRAVGLALRTGGPMMLYRPIARERWLVGRLLGAWGVLLGVCLGLFSVWSLFALWWAVPVTQTLGFYAVLLCMELIVLSTLAGLLSSLIEPTMATLCTLGLWVAGHLTHELTGSTGWALQDLATRLVQVLVPDLQRFNLHTQVVHHTAVAPMDVAWACVYGAVWTGALVSATAWILHRRDLT